MRFPLALCLILSTLPASAQNVDALRGTLQTGSTSERHEALEHISTTAPLLRALIPDILPLLAIKDCHTKACETLAELATEPETIVQALLPYAHPSSELGPPALVAS